MLLFLKNKNWQKNQQKDFLWFLLVFQSISASSSSSSHILLPANWASSTSDSVILKGLPAFCCLVRIIICSLRTLYPSAQCLPGLKQLIYSSSSLLPSIVKAHFLNKDATISFGKNFLQLISSQGLIFV